MAHRNRSIAIAASFAAAVGVVSLSLGQARLECAMAALVFASAIAFPRRTIGSSRKLAVGATAVLIVVAVLAYVVAGRKVSYDAHPHQLPRLLGITSICVSATVIWFLARSTQLSMRARVALAGAVAVVEAVAITIAAIKGDTSHVVYVVNGGFFHGRLGIWSGALGSGIAHVFTGHGADYSLITSPVPLPGDAITDAYDFPLEMLVELGILGLGLALALYGTVLRDVWRARTRRHAWVFTPAVIGFLLADLLDWEWHLAGAGAVWAIALGALIADTPIRVRRHVGAHHEATQLRSEGPTADQPIPI
jgi:hypothetical protein